MSSDEANTLPRTRSREKEMQRQILERINELNKKLCEEKINVEERKEELLKIRRDIEKIPCEERYNLTEKYNEAQDNLQEIERKQRKKLNIKDSLSNTVMPNEKKEESENQKVKNLIEILIPEVKEDHEKIELSLLEGNRKCQYSNLLDNLKESWKEANEQYHRLLHDGYNLGDIVYEMKNLRTKTTMLREKLKSQVEKPEGNLNLPNYSVPTFFGDYEKWPEFFDGFSMLVDNEVRLSKLEKMKHLKTHVKGEAGRLIQHMNITEKNYDHAWSMLKERYQNTRLIVKKLIDRLLDSPEIEYESATKMKNLLNLVQECIKAIESIGIDTTTWGPIINIIVQRKWDKESKKLYEQTIVKSHEIENLNQILDFMRTRFEALEICSPKRPVKENVIEREERKPRNLQQCILCNLPHHIGNSWE